MIRSTASARNALDQHVARVFPDGYAVIAVVNGRVGNIQIVAADVKPVRVIRAPISKKCDVREPNAPCMHVEIEARRIKQSLFSRSGHHRHPCPSILPPPVTVTFSTASPYSRLSSSGKATGFFASYGEALQVRVVELGHPPRHPTPAQPTSTAPGSMIRVVCEMSSPGRIKYDPGGTITAPWLWHAAMAAVKAPVASV